MKFAEILKLLGLLGGFATMVIGGVRIYDKIMEGQGETQQVIIESNRSQISGDSAIMVEVIAVKDSIKTLTFKMNHAETLHEQQAKSMKSMDESFEFYRENVGKYNDEQMEEVIAIIKKNNEIVYHD